MSIIFKVIFDCINKKTKTETRIGIERKAKKINLKFLVLYIKKGEKPFNMKIITVIIMGTISLLTKR